MPQLVENIGGIRRVAATVNNQPDAFAQDEIDRTIGVSQIGYIVPIHGGTAIGDLRLRCIAFDEFEVGKSGVGPPTVIYYTIRTNRSVPRLYDGSEVFGNFVVGLPDLVMPHAIGCRNHGRHKQDDNGCGDRDPPQEGRIGHIRSGRAPKTGFHIVPVFVAETGFHIRRADRPQN